MNNYTPKPWKRGECCIGAEWHGWRVFLGQNRDSNAMDRCNFNAALETLLPLSTEIESGDDEGKTVRVVSENHWACGWIEWIAIHGSNTAALAEANRIADRLERYPVLDEDALCQLENNEAMEYWHNHGRREFIQGLERAELIEEGALDESDEDAIWELYCALIPSGDYYDSEGLNIDYAVERATRDGLPEKESEACGLVFTDDETRSNGPRKA
jgi:hypothetical protein